MGIEKGEDRPAPAAEFAGKPVGLGDHLPDLGIFHRRGQIARAHGREAVDLVDDDQADLACAEPFARELDGHGLGQLSQDAIGLAHECALQSLRRVV